MLDYLDGQIERSDWIRLGGDATLLSYGVDTTRLRHLGNAARDDAMIRETVPEEHRIFLRQLPVLVESPRYVFVHAGIWPDRPLDEQSDRDLTTMRQKFYAMADQLDRFVIHGHTPITTPQLEGRRLDIDTGAYFSGRLTAVRIWRGTGRFLTGQLAGSSGTADTAR
jgi:serine/threonine protein phosphatase 1